MPFARVCEIIPFWDFVVLLLLDVSPIGWHMVHFMLWEVGFGQLMLGHSTKKCSSKCNPIMRSWKPVFFYNSNNCIFPIITCGLFNSKFIKHYFCDLKTSYNVCRLLEL
jgi:hypothetical protein